MVSDKLSHQPSPLLIIQCRDSSGSWYSFQRIREIEAMASRVTPIDYLTVEAQPMGFDQGPPPDNGCSRRTQVFLRRSLR